MQVQHPRSVSNAPQPAQVRRGILASYVLPLKSSTPIAAELSDYIRWLSDRVEMIVVDSSDDSVFDVHAGAWGDSVRHVRPDPAKACANGKVHNVLSGLALVSHQRIVIADDDVRYDEAGLLRAVSLLDDYDLVRPQNYFDPLPWHAAWDTGRSLLNRSIAADFPGTLAVRKEVLERTGGYDGDVLFENFELIRTVEAAGGTAVGPLDLYVRRLPPSAEHFWGQRIRQAYDELARPHRMVAELSVIPLTATALARRKPAYVGLGVASIIAVAEAGRRRAGGTAFFPPRTAFAAPLWVAERAVCSWVALGHRVARGGVPYAGGVLRRPATPMRQLRRRHGGDSG